mmetsp:Transcript_4162/g.9744  ORF Transcript_4162/g.9744 Transcript_4162/m.9744 type:complete len:373 (+) Transcript_4162:395-1513(+)
MHVLATAPSGDPRGVCEAIERFGYHNLSRAHGGKGGQHPSAGQWLKVAGGEKAKVLAAAVRLCLPRVGAGGLQILEVGSYCGYSAIRLAIAAGCLAQVLALEADPGYAIVARCIIAHAGLGQRVRVRMGHSEDVLTHLAGLLDSREGLFDLVFFDQRGSRYLADLMVLEQGGLLAPAAVLVADNVLKPGAPIFIWHVIHARPFTQNPDRCLFFPVAGRYATQILPVEEFAMPGSEDWLSISIGCPGRPWQDGKIPTVPGELRRLEWEGDKIRWLAERQLGVNFQRWANFAAKMKKGLADVGITPQTLMSSEEDWHTLETTLRQRVSCNMKGRSASIECFGMKTSSDPAGFQATEELVPTSSGQMSQEFDGVV